MNDAIAVRNQEMLCTMRQQNKKQFISLDGRNNCNGFPA